MADDTRHAAVVESLKATASELHARPPEDMNNDWADRMAEALAAAGLLAAPAEQPIITWHPSDGPTEEITPGDLCLIGGKEGTFRVASPAAPADDEATVKRMQRAIHDELCECAGGVSPCPHSSADLNAAARAALAALREGQ